MDIKEELYKLINSRDVLSISEIKSSIGKYTSTQILEFFEDIEEEKGINVYVDKSKRYFSLKPLEGYKDVSDILRTVKIGFISNPRLVSTHSSISALYAAYKIFEEEDVVWINVVGNLFNDTVYRKTNPDKIREYLPEMENLENRINYVSRIYPRISGRKTHVKAGKRDIAYFKEYKSSINQIKELAKTRNDIRLEEREFQEVYGTNVKIYLVPVQNDDGTSKYYTYDAQERVENLNVNKDENDFVIVVFGGYHIPFEFPNYGRANYVISLPSLIFQTEYMKTRRKVNPVIGCYVLELNLSKKNPETKRRKLVSLKTRFYNLEKYAKRLDFYKVPEISDIKQRALLKYIFERGEASYGELSRFLKVTEDEVKDLIEKINGSYKGFIKESNEKVTLKLPLNYEFNYPEIKSKEEIKALLTSDWHIGSENTKEDLVTKILSVARNSNVDFILHTGDLLEAIPGAYLFEGQQFKMKVVSTEELIRKLLEKILVTIINYEIPFIFILGNHDTRLFKKIGFNILEDVINKVNLEFLIEKLKEEKNLEKFIKGFENKERLLVLLNDEYGSFKYRGKLFTLIHPSGGSQYTLGYPLYKFGKNYETSLLIALGNYHKALFVFDRNLRYLVPALKHKDDFFETRALLSHEGFWVSKIGLLDDKTVLRVENSYVDLSEETRTEVLEKVKLPNGLEIEILKD